MAQATIIKFPVHSFRKQPTPYDQDGKSKYYAVVNVKDVPAELNEWRELNIRDPKEEIKVPKEIKASLQDDPASFFFKNRGILILADRVTFDNKTDLIEVLFADKAMNGLADGGHSYRVIRNHIENLSPEELAEVNAYITVEFLEGFKSREEVVPIIEARNKSTPVQEQSIQELLGSFDLIKAVIANKPYSGRVFYKQYEESVNGVEKDIDVKEILSYLVCFDTESFDDKSHPIKAYSSRAAVIDHFKKNKTQLEKYIMLLPEILELRDTIYMVMPTVYNSHGGKFGKLKGVDKVSRGANEELVFIGKESEYRIPSGFVLPVLAAFRNLVKVENGRCSWKADPFKLLSDLQDELVNLVGEQASKLQNPNELGKDMATWRLCYGLVENTVLKRHI